MKILYEGNDIVPWCTEVHLTESFRALGHDVMLVAPQDTDPIGLLFLLDSYQPDVFLLTRPWGTRSAVTPQFARRCRERGIPTVGFHLDLFWGLPERERWVRDKSDPLFRMDHLFSTDGAHDTDWSTCGINHHWMPPAVYAPECYDATPDEKWAGVKVGFVGSAPTALGGNYHPEHGHRRELVAHLTDWYGDQFVHVGNGGPIGTLRGGDLNRFYASVPVIVGDSCFVRADRAYWSDRVPETWGRGGFLIHPRVDALVEQLGEGYPGSTWDAGDWSALRDCIDGWLGDAYARGGTRQRIAATIRAEHTYTIRARTILATVFGDRP